MQLLGGSPLEGLYSSSYGEQAVQPIYSYGATRLPAAATLQLHGHSPQPQASPLTQTKQPCIHLPLDMPDSVTSMSLFQISLLGQLTV